MVKLAFCRFATPKSVAHVAPGTANLFAEDFEPHVVQLDRSECLQSSSDGPCSHKVPQGSAPVHSSLNIEAGGKPVGDNRGCFAIEFDFSAILFSFICPLSRIKRCDCTIKQEHYQPVRVCAANIRFAINLLIGGDWTGKHLRLQRRKSDDDAIVG